MRCVPKNKDAYASAEFMLGDSMMTTKYFLITQMITEFFVWLEMWLKWYMITKQKQLLLKVEVGIVILKQCKLYNKEELNGAVKANPMTGFRPVYRIKENTFFWLNRKR